jgi:hypothetical protein
MAYIASTMKSKVNAGGIVHNGQNQRHAKRSEGEPAAGAGWAAIVQVIAGFLGRLRQQEYSNNIRQ